jgi:hypothetical protein
VFYEVEGIHFNFCLRLSCSRSFSYVRVCASMCQYLQQRGNICVCVCVCVCACIIVTPDFLIVSSRVHWRLSVTEIETVINKEMADC